MAIVDLEFKAWVAQMESEFPQMFHDETASRVAMDFRLDIARMAFTAGRSAQRKALSHAAGQECTLGVGDGSGQLFVHGSYDAIKACQALILRGEAAGQEAVASSFVCTGDQIRCFDGNGCECELNGLLQKAQAAQPASAEVERNAVLGSLPAPITNPEAWPPGYADGFNDAARLAYESASAAMAASSGRK